MNDVRGSTRWDALTPGGEVSYAIVPPCFFLNPLHKAMSSMKMRCRSGRPAKIAPLKPPKEIHDESTPRCAMEANSSDDQMLELDQSQEGLEIISSENEKT